ncbi:MAG: hypothetical protein JXR79_06535 [Nitrospirae bacterium]|nr:hypothetical protein [Nitrospirota bacterium]
MISRVLYYLMVVILAAAVTAADPESISAEQTDGEKQININLPLPICTKAKISFWLIENQLQSVNDLVFQLKGCSVNDDLAVCGFEVTNCGDRSGWFFLESSSSFYDSTGTSYELRKKSIAGSSSLPDGLAKTFLNKGQTEPGQLIFHYKGAAKSDFTLSVVLTGGKWAGEMNKSLFKNIKINK